MSAPTQIGLEPSQPVLGTTRMLTQPHQAVDSSERTGGPVATFQKTLSTGALPPTNYTEAPAGGQAGCWMSLIWGILMLASCGFLHVPVEQTPAMPTHTPLHAAPLPVSGSVCLRGFSGHQGPPARGWGRLEVSGNSCSPSSPQPLTERRWCVNAQVPHPFSEKTLKCVFGTAPRGLPGD